VPREQTPFLSVMLPTCEPDEFLLEAIESVFSQAPLHETEIVVVDDASTRADVAALVRSIDPSGRVRVVAEGLRLGLAGNWNRAISLARGRLVHLLHQDDLVLPGFYGRVAAAFVKAPSIGMAFCRSRIIDGAGRCLKTSSRLRWFPGVLDGWHERIALRQRVQTPSVIVARSTYERVGGYRDDLPQTLDWEMWARIAAAFPVWYEPRPLAAYRRHDANQTARLLAAGTTWRDVARAILIIAESLPADRRGRITTQAARWQVGSLVRTVIRHIEAGDATAAGVTLESLPRLVAMAVGDGSRGLGHPLRALDRAVGRAPAEVARLLRMHRPGGPFSRAA
jgi:hypothetical protein